jgi:DNA-binding response OmpR family regulator
MIQTILIVEDDNDLREFLVDLLLDNGYSVKTAEDGVEALKQLKKSQPDLILLDLNLPNIKGETVCTEVKKDYPEIPVIILTAKTTTPEIVHGLSLGADDYIAKPFETDELLARIRARLRSPHHTSNDVLEVSDLKLNTQTIELNRGKKKIKLTPQEYKLLEYLMRNPGRVLTREAILNRIWPYSPDVETRVVDVYIGYLRKKIDSDFPKKLIHSVRGFGYTIRE